MRRAILLMLAGLLLMISVMGCNTMEGFGRDMKGMGSSIENSGK